MVEVPVHIPSLLHACTRGEPVVTVSATENTKRQVV